PHQTASPVSIVGGGQNPRPGEISLAHRGVLFLDELPEFRRDLLEALRQPLESGKIIISRVKNNLIFPARFILVAAMNPCPCGYYGDKEEIGGKECKCSAYEIFRYQKKISGPLLDRIDIQINVPRTKIENLKKPREDSSNIKSSILSARAKQIKRFENMDRKILTNAEMNSKECEELINLSANAEKFLEKIFDTSNLSTRTYYRILKTARTIADLEESETIETPHISEAFQLRVRNE
ncbi:MAG TPA: ATP-binding protein, partial [Candidatus Paceibacterota bacterium]